MKADLRLAYEKADYVVSGVRFHIGDPNPELDALVATTAAYITAANPHSKVQSPLHNEMAHERLRALVAAYPSLPAESRDPVKQFPPEKGLLVLGIALADAMTIGRVLEQNAIVFVEKHRPPQLVVLV
ncbi:MAG TPA: DUF3293 domain-containing protein [Burkholderiales bacterium]|nr:DUF3293 domain-containing protein [Burkholderiales bacterium]